MARLPILLLLALAAAREPWPPGATVLEPDDTRAGAIVVVPAEGASGHRLLVALHEMGAAPADLTERLAAATKEGYVLLCPAAAGISFGESDLSPVAERVSEVAEAIGAPSVHLVGFEDAAARAIRFAFARPRMFRTVAAIGADAPEVRERAPGLRVLVMKGADDRPRAGLESAVALRDRAQAVDFRELPGDGRVLDAATARYLAWFLDVADGKVEPGVDLAYRWWIGPAGLAARKRLDTSALVYLTDPDPAHSDRTAEIQREVLFEPALRAAAEGSVAIRAERATAADLFPGLPLAPGPALLVLGRDGSVVTAQQKKLDAAALAAALAAGR